MKRVILALAITSLVLTLGGIGLFTATDARYCNLFWIILYNCPPGLALDLIHPVQLLLGLGLLVGFASGLMGISATNLSGRWGCFFGIWHFGMLLVLLLTPAITLFVARPIFFVLARVSLGLADFAFNAFLFVPLLLLPLPALIYGLVGPERRKAV